MSAYQRDKLIAEINRLRFVGGQLSNIAYNLSQSSKQLTDHDLSQFAKLVREWDAIARTITDRPAKKAV